jgi:hypothetical protein
MKGDEVYLVSLIWWLYASSKRLYMYTVLKNNSYDRLQLIDVKLKVLLNRRRQDQQTDSQCGVIIVMYMYMYIYIYNLTTPYEEKVCYK